MTKITRSLPAVAWTVLAAAALFAANFALHHGNVFGQNRLAYFGIVVLGIGTGLTLAVAARLDVGLLAAGFSPRRPLMALLLAAAAGGALLTASVGGIVVADPRRALNLFLWLWMTSVVEVLVFLGLVYNVVRAVAGRFVPAWLAVLVAVCASSLLFGAYHFTYSPPWNTLKLAGTVAVVWLFVAALFIASDSFWAAVVFNNCAASVGFLRNGIAALDGEQMALGLALDALLVAVVVAGIARLRSGPAGPVPVEPRPPA